jgi:hypothetical protein
MSSDYCFGMMYLAPKIETMYIEDTKTLRQVKQEFQDKFKWLKLEFYSKEHEPGQGSAQVNKLDEELTIGEVRSVHSEGELNIHGNLKVSSLEEQFKTLYGLNVQVFRRSGEIWLQTTSTDDWSLQDQNERGEDASGGNAPTPEATTYEVD